MFSGCFWISSLVCPIWPSIMLYLLSSTEMSEFFLSCSTWVKSKCCSWSEIGGSGKASLLMPEVKRNQACRCLDSWDASITSCLMRPLAHWPSSLQVRWAKIRPTAAFNVFKLAEQNSTYQTLVGKMLCTELTVEGLKSRVTSHTPCMFTARLTTCWCLCMWIPSSSLCSGPLALSPCCVNKQREANWHKLK